MKLQTRMGQQLIMTPLLQQAIKLLQMTSVEIEQLVQQNLLENPVLEEVDTNDDSNLSENLEQNNTEEDFLQNSDPEYDFDSYNVDSFEDIRSTKTNDFDENQNVLEATHSEKISLNKHLAQQIMLGNFNENESELLNYLANNIYNNGYLDGSLRELLASSKEMFGLTKQLINKYPLTEEFDPSLGDLCFTEQNKKKEKPQNNFWCSPEDITQNSIYVLNSLLLKLQKLDPTGIGSRNLTECLACQAGESFGPNSLEKKIIEKHLKLLTEKKYKKIAKKLEVNIEAIIDAHQNIQLLNPFPGDEFTKKEAEPITPDVFVVKRGDDYIIKLNSTLSKFRINPIYQEMLKGYRNKKLRQANIESEKDVSNRYILEKVRAGEWLIKNIAQRQDTIYKVAESIVKKQKKFFKYGKEYLEPMILKNIADDIEMHESTVSRISNQKYIQTPRGIFEIKFFFSSGIEQQDGKIISSLKIKEHIQKIVAKEDKKKPFTDDCIAIKLQELEKIDVARRTVAKYREVLKIPSSNRRKRL